MIEGARCIDKSTIVEDFAKDEYKSYILIEFSKKDKDVVNYFNQYLNDLEKSEKIGVIKLSRFLMLTI